MKGYAESVNTIRNFSLLYGKQRLFLTNAGVARNPRIITSPEQKMGLPPAHAKTKSAVPNPEPRRWLSRIFCGRGVQDRKKNWYSSRRLAST